MLLRNLRSLVLPALLAFAAAGAAPAQSSAQGRITLAPSVVSKSDTSDHVDIAFQGAAIDSSAVVVASVYSVAGTKLANQRVSWTSSDTSIVVVSGTSTRGTIKARGFGSATLTATSVTSASKGVSASIPVCVYGSSYPGTVSVVGQRSAVAVGDSVQFVAISSLDGQPFPSACVHWTASSNIAKINRRGMVYGLRLPESPTLNVTAFVGVPVRK